MDRSSLYFLLLGTVPVVYAYCRVQREKTRKNPNFERDSFMPSAVKSSLKIEIDHIKSHISFDKTGFHPSNRRSLTL
jgi:hypothetical protein